MKKIWRLLILLLTLFWGSFVFAQGQEKIDSFEVTISINHDSSLDIEERIVYDFGSNFRHGIYRDIPIKYRARGGNYNLRISDIRATDQNGIPYKFELLLKGRYQRIKIGDEKKVVWGKKTYLISYKIKRALNYFKDYDELYWNVTGNEWNVPIKWASAKVILPQSVKGEELRTACFKGPFGSKNPCGAMSKKEVGSFVKEVSFAETLLSPQEGLTIVVGWPKGLVAKPSFWQLAFEVFRDNWIIALPIFTFLILFSLWYKGGRDPKGRGTIIAQYEPPDKLSPAEVGTIVDEKAQKHDISSLIIDLAVRGYLRIRRTKEKLLIFTWSDYELEKLKEGDDLENDFEKDLFRALFKDAKKVKKNGREIETVKLSHLKNRFYKDFQKVVKEVYKAVSEKGYFVKNPNKVRAKYASFGILIFFLMYPLMFFRQPGLITILSFLVTAFLFFIFSFLMPKKTKKGVLAKEHILGFKEYLRVAEKERLRFHNAPQKDPQLFEKFLPYAMVLGVEKEWARQFEGIYQGSPSWYEDERGAPFSPVLVVTGLQNFSQATNTTLSSRPGRGAAGGRTGFGGGGFSGGGFGGGGGGSW